MKASAGKHVLMLLENNPYPQDDRVKREAQTLTQGGYKVTVIAPAGKNQPWRDVVQGVRVYRYPAPAPGDSLRGYLWEYGYSLVAMLLFSLFVFIYDRFSIIHAHNPPDISVLIAALYKPFGVRFIFDHHDIAPENYHARFTDGGNRLVYYALVFFEILSCRLANHVIATNESYKKLEMQRSKLPEERITIVRNGPDLNRVRLVDPDPQLRDSGKTILGYVGIMGVQDGVDYLLRALRHLIDDVGRTDFFCIIVGKGDAWNDLRALATELQLDEYVWFTGRIPDEDLMRYLSTADICVGPDPKNPFTDRSTMIKMTEFMALAKPIVAFDLTEHRFTAQEAALYAEPNDERDFARKIAMLMDDPQRRRQMGQYGRERIEKHLAWNHQEQPLLAAYASLG